MGREEVDIADLPLRELTEFLRSGKISVQSLMAACLERVAGRERDVRAFVELRAQTARDAAAAADGLGRQERQQPLFGVPVAVDEVCDVAGFRCRRGSPVFGDRVPEADSGIVARLGAAGAIAVATTVTGELATIGHGPTRNPHDLVRTGGGVASGAAAAVAAGMVPLALSVEAGGAMLRAASYCGALGLRLTRGALPVGDVEVPVPYAAAAGLFARRADDLRVAVAALSEETAFREAVERTGLDGVSVCLVEGPMEPLVAEPCRQVRSAAVETFAALGLPVERMRLSEWSTEALTLIDAIAAFELAGTYGEVRDSRPEALSDALRARIDRGRRLSAGAYEESKRLARSLGQRVTGQLDARTVLLDVATLDPAPLRSQRPGSTAALAPWALAGMPAAVVPFGTDGRLPTAVQIVARPGEDGLVLAVAEALMAAR